MDERGDDGGMLPPLARELAGRVDETVVESPSCPRCLERMEVQEAANGEPYWSCTACGQVLLA